MMLILTPKETVTAQNPLVSHICIKHLALPTCAYTARDYEPLWIWKWTSRKANNTLNVQNKKVYRKKQCLSEDDDSRGGERDVEEEEEETEVTDRQRGSAEIMSKLTVSLVLNGRMEGSRMGM